MPKTIDKATLNPNILLGIIVVLLVTIVFLTYKLYSQTLQQLYFSSAVSGVMAVTVPVVNAELSTTPKGTLLTNPQLGYTVIVPE